MFFLKTPIDFRKPMVKQTTFVFFSDTGVLSIHTRREDGYVSKPTVSISIFKT